MMPVIKGTTHPVDENKSTRGPTDTGIKPPGHLDCGQQSFSPSTTSAITTGLFTDPDATVKRQLIPPRFTENDENDKDVPEAEFGRLNVHRDLGNRGQVSQTLQRTARSSISLALKKGPLPPVPSRNDRPTSQQTPQYSVPVSQGPPRLPPPPPLPSQAPLERIQRSASFQPVGPARMPLQLCTF
ncbi:uncharacterized protein AB9W97_002800 [Spinachia spinachia]